MDEIVQLYKENRPKVNWKQIDAAMGKQSYQKMPFSYKYFHDVIMVRYQPQWTRNDMGAIDNCLYEILQEHRHANVDDPNAFL